MEPRRGNQYLNLVSFIIVLIATSFTLFQVLDWAMRPKTFLSFALPWVSLAATQNTTVDLKWHAPKKTWINNLDAILKDNGTHDFYFNGSTLPAGTKYGVYNWCNMPHVRRNEYPVPNEEYTLEYVEVVSVSTQKGSQMRGDIELIGTIDSPSP
jgi:hypothetical protein